jgi:hypothetical protein
VHPNQEDYRYDIRKAIESKDAERSESMEVDNPTGNKREASFIEEEDSNSSKRQKSSNNDSSSGSSGPSDPSDPDSSTLYGRALEKRS